MNDVQTEQPSNFSGVGGLSNVGQDRSSERLSNMRNLNYLISDMSKYTILIAISLLSSFIFYAISSAVTVLIYPDNENRAVGIMIIAFDGLINCLCLIFQFDFSRKQYKKYFRQCHTFCENRYTNETNKRVARGGSKKRLQRLPSGQIGLQVDAHSEVNDDDDAEEHDEQGNNNNNNVGADPADAANDVQMAPIAMVVQTSVETLGA